MKTKTYLLATFEVTEENLEGVYAAFYFLNSCGLEEKDLGNGRVRFSASFEEEVTESDVSGALTSYLASPDNLKMERVRADDVRFKPKPFDPVELVSGFWIVPPPELAEGMVFPEGQKMVIRPGAAFGTGRHESTRLASQLIAKTRPAAQSLLDVGTGSGILSIYAGLTGFKELVAVEIDDESRINAGENFELNHIVAPLHEALEKVSGTFDVVVANIVTPTLVEIKSELLKRLKKSGTLILSGITIPEAPVIEKEFGDLKIVGTVTEGEWKAYAYSY